jgi:urea transport system substrate-binding protein
MNERSNTNHTSSRKGTFARLGWLMLAGLLVASLPAVGVGCKKAAPVDDAKTVKVGILHSLSGTMAISETSLKDAELMAIEEINAAGGVLGKKIEPVVEDPASDFTGKFPELAKKLLLKDKVACVFGCWS